MPRKTKKLKVFEPYFCPKCGNEVPRGQDGILVTIYNRELDTGCCSDCGDKPSPVVIEEAIKMAVELLAEKLWKNHHLSWNQLTPEWRYKLYQRFLGASMEEAQEAWARAQTGITSQCANEAASTGDGAEAPHNVASK